MSKQMVLKWDKIWKKPDEELGYVLRRGAQGISFIVECDGIETIRQKYLPRLGLVLEAGCGWGRYALYLSLKGIRVMGLDISNEALYQLKNLKSRN